MKRTYALFDVIGTTEAFMKEPEPRIVKDLWELAESWVEALDHRGFRTVRVPETNQDRCPEAFIVTFSDSALLSTRVQIGLDNFYRLVEDLRKKLLERIAKVYCIVSCNEELEHPSIALFGGRTVHGDITKPVYFNVAGSGRAFANLFQADLAVKRANDPEGGQWHEKGYWLYCAGEYSKPSPTASEKGRLRFNRFPDRQPEDLIALR
jgi:hypothetical protein